MDEKQEIETLIKKSEKRIAEYVKEGFKYHHLSRAISNKSLRDKTSKRLSMTIMFVDLVGSTKLSAEIPPITLARVVKGFSQETTFVIEHFGGHVLKYVGDAVIGYFLSDTQNAVLSARALIQVMKKSINPTMRKHGLQELGLHIGIDHGKNSILLYGEDKKKSHIDMIGLTMNLAAKMESISGFNQIIIGDSVYKKLNFKLKKDFKKVENKRWKYYHMEHQRAYPVYESIFS